MLYPIYPLASQYLWPSQTQGPRLVESPGGIMDLQSHILNSYE